MRRSNLWFSQRPSKEHQQEISEFLPPNSLVGVIGGLYYDSCMALGLGINASQEDLAESFEPPMSLEDFEYRDLDTARFIHKRIIDADFIGTTVSVLEELYVRFVLVLKFKPWATGKLVLSFTFIDQCVIKIMVCNSMWRYCFIYLKWNPVFPLSFHKRIFLLLKPTTEVHSPDLDDNSSKQHDRKFRTGVFMHPSTHFKLGRYSSANQNRFFRFMNN